MSQVKLIIRRGLRLHFYFHVGNKDRYFAAKLRNKDKVILRLLNALKWKITFPEDDCLTKHAITLEAVDPGEDVVKALRALMNIRGLKRGEAERLKKLPIKEVCRELALKSLVG